MRGCSRISCGSIMAVLLLACGAEAPPPRLPHPEPVAGPAVGGLSIRARLDAMHGLIHFDIENVSQAPISYVDYWVGYHEGVALDVRRAGTDVWTRLPRRPFDHRIYNSAGPSERHQVTVAPGLRMPTTILGRSVAQHRFDENGPRPGLETPLGKEAFLADLLDFLWPEALGDLGRGTMELRVIQGFPDWSELLPVKGGAWVLPSANLRLNLAEMPTEVRSALARTE